MESVLNFAQCRRSTAPPSSSQVHGTVIPPSTNFLQALSPLSGPVRTFPSPSLSRQSPLISPVSPLQLQVPYTCKFYEAPDGGVALYPPGDICHHTQLCHIRVTLSCFMPTSFITTIERGGTRQPVARFETGLSRDPPKLFMGNTPYQLGEVFTNFRKVGTELEQERWRWIRGRFALDL
ncbi:hypothetical protein BC835DRAFT_291132 [Cytidiella melzeri]|nr:hypothetical protein BC835DRAFT_291132 [Cytidiella melzeri]